MNAVSAQAQPPEAVLLRLRGVCKRYPFGQTQVTALQGVNLDIDNQGITVLSGPSGSGKTTLLNLLGALDQPDSGSIEVLGHPIERLDEDARSRLRAERLGFIFQRFNLLPVLTALENVEYPLQLLGVGPRERRERALAMLHAVGVAALAQQRPGTLSGGQQQRVAIARALVKQPAVVLADEPTANLDSSNARAVLALLRQLQQQTRTAVVVSSHDPLVLQHADRVVHLRDGRVLDAVPVALGAPHTADSAEWREPELAVVS